MIRCGIVLAAGVGSRLGRKQPKWLADVSGAPIADVQMSALRAVETVVVVAGYRQDLVVDYLRRSHPDRVGDVVVVENPLFASKNNYYSALLGVAAAARVVDNQDSVTLLINSDLYASPRWFEETVAAVSAAETPVTLACDPSAVDSAEAMRVETVKGGVPGNLKRIGKQVSGDAEYVGLLSLNTEGLVQFQKSLNELDEASDDHDEWYESGLQLMVDGGIDVDAVPVAGPDWVEIDTPADMHRASAVAERWAS